MGWCDSLVSRGMAVDDHDFSCVDEYVACVCATVDDTPLLNFAGWKGVREFYKGRR